MKYWGFGQVFESEMEIPELLLAPEELSPNVTIKFGQVPEHLPEVVERGVAFEAATAAFLLNVEETGRYLVREGSEIIIQPAENVPLPRLRVFLLSSCLGALLHQQKVFPLHASGIVHKGRAVLFAGFSGVGKSTTLAAFRGRGYKVLTDDIACLKLGETGEVLAFPGIPRARLWADALRRMGLEEEPLTRPRPEINKFDLDLREDFVHEPFPLGRIFILATHNGDEIAVNDLSKFESFRSLAMHTYRKNFVKGFKRQKEHFELLQRVAEQTSLTLVSRPYGGFRLEELVEAVEERL